MTNICRPFRTGDGPRVGLPLPAENRLQTADVRNKNRNHDHKVEF